MAPGGAVSLLEEIGKQGRRGRYFVRSFRGIIERIFVGDFGKILSKDGGECFGRNTF